MGECTPSKHTGTSGELELEGWLKACVQRKCAKETRPHYHVGCQPGVNRSFELYKEVNKISAERAAEALAESAVWYEAAAARAAARVGV